MLGNVTNHVWMARNGGKRSRDKRTCNFFFIWIPIGDGREMEERELKGMTPLHFKQNNPSSIGKI